MVSGYGFQSVASRAWGAEEATVKPILLLTCRGEDDATAQEAAMLRRFTGLAVEDFEHHRVEAAPLPDLEVSDYRGVILGGSPYNASDEVKSETQQRVEADLNRVLAQVLATEKPFLGLCYGVGALTNHAGGLVDRTWGESTSLTVIDLTEVGRSDPLFAGLPDQFQAFTAHKEACTQLPPDAVLLASGPTCPVQSYRLGTSAYVTQFHPELDGDALAERMIIYRNSGYFAPQDLDKVVAFARSSQPSPQAHRILANFAALTASRA